MPIGMPYLMPIFSVLTVVLPIWGVCILYLITKALRM